MYLRGYSLSGPTAGPRRVDAAAAPSTFRQDGNIQPSVKECNPGKRRSAERSRDGTWTNGQALPCALPSEEFDAQQTHWMRLNCGRLERGVNFNERCEKIVRGIGSPDGGRTRNLRLERATS